MAATLVVPSAAEVSPQTTAQKRESSRSRSTLIPGLAYVTHVTSLASKRLSRISEKVSSRRSTTNTRGSVTSDSSLVWHESHPTFISCVLTGDTKRRVSKAWRFLRRRWVDFTLFGINREDPSPRVWGHDFHSEGHTNEKGALFSTSKSLQDMVQAHQFQEEMRLQLRDERIRLHYLDAFRTDCEPGKHTIRVFSIGATLFEYLKLAISVWTFIFALTVAAFWTVVRPLNDKLLFVDGCVDLVYAVCLMLQFRTTLLNAEVGREVCSTKKIARKHLQDIRFWVDFVSCVPVYMLHRASFGIDLVPSAGRWLVALKALRGWRIYRLPPKHRFLPSMSFLLVRLCLGMMMGGHCLACIWFMLVHEKERSTSLHVLAEDSSWDKCVEASQVGVLSPAGCWVKLYSLSVNQGLYLLMGMDRAAFSSLEHFFLTLCMPLGSLVHAYVLGEVILLLQMHGALEMRQNEHAVAIQEAMKVLGLPPVLQVRIITYFTYERLHRSGRLFSQFFADLSPQLRFELQLHLYLDLVVQSGLFKEMRPRVIREIVVNLKDLIFLPGDWICRFGDYGDSMYFIVTGECTVVAKDTVTELMKLSRGEYFGEVALLTGVPRTAYVLANTFCILAHLTQDGFEPIMRKWPEEIDTILGGVASNMDRVKIKEEATRHYNLGSRKNSTVVRRRSSLNVGAPKAAQDASRRKSSLLSGVQDFQATQLQMGSGAWSCRNSFNGQAEPAQPSAVCDRDGAGTSDSLGPGLKSAWRTLQQRPLAELQKRLSQCYADLGQEAEDGGLGSLLMPVQPPGSRPQSPMQQPPLLGWSDGVVCSSDSEMSEAESAQIFSLAQRLLTEQAGTIVEVEMQLNEVEGQVAALDGEVRSQAKHLGESFVELKHSVFQAVREVIAKEASDLESCSRGSTPIDERCSSVGGLAMVI